jgi:hypothetical protein
MSGGGIGSAWISIGATGQAEFQAQARAIAETAVKSIRPDVQVTADTKPAIAKLTALKAATASLQSGLADLRVNANTTGALAKVVALQARAAALGKTLGNISPNVSSDSLLSTESRMLAVTAATEKLAEAQDAAADATGNAGDAAVRTSGSYSLFGKVIKTISDANIPLFASAMDKTALSVLPGVGSALDKLLPHFLVNASGIHMAAEAVIEFTAVWAPAGVAMTAFVAAAIPEAIKVYDQLDAMNSVAKATGATFSDFPKLTGDLTNALKPQLLELYGIALQGIDSSSGKLGSALDTVAMGVDNVAAKIVAWMQGSGGNGMSDFIKSGAQDAGLLGDAFVQLGRILQTVLESVPGYAKMLLEFGDACLTVLADVVHFIQPAIALFLKLHGAIFYLGIATTLVASFGSAMIKAAAATALGNTVDETTGKMSAMGSAIGTLIGKLALAAAATYAYSASVVALASDEGIAAAASKVLADAADAIPFTEVGVLGAGLAAVIGGALYLAFRKTTSATQEFVNAQNAMIAASNVVNLQVDIANALTNTSQAIAANNSAISKYNSMQKAATASGNAAIAANNESSYAMIAATRAADQASMANAKLTPAQAAYNQELDNTAVRLPALTGQFGSVVSVMGLMNLAGVNANQVATDTNSQFTQMIIKLTGVAEGYGLMTQQAGAAGAQLDTINISTASASKALSTLTAAESGYLSLVTGGVSDLGTFVSGQTSLGKATSGTAQATIAGRAAFASQINAAGTLLGSLQSLSSASGNTAASQKEVTEAMKGTIAMMLPFAKGSATNTAELSALAQLVGGPATDNFQTLAKWVGNTTAANTEAATATDKLTIASANLSAAAKNLATTLSADITAGQAAAIMQDGLSAATNAFSKAMQTSNDTLTTSVKLAGADYYAALVKAGVSTSNATQYVDAFMRSQGYAQTAISQMNTYLDTQAKKLTTVKQAAQSAKDALSQYAQGSPYNATVNTTVGADGTVQVTGKGAGLNDVLAHISFRGQGFSGGGVVPGASAGGDNQLAMVKSGELIIPSQHAARFGSMAKAAGIPGFASGGVVGAVSAVSNTDQQGMQAGAQQSMTQAVKDLTSYVKSQASTGGSPVNYSPTAGVNQWKSVVLQALAMNGLPASLLNQVLYQMQTESGGNPNAQNNWDSNAAAGDPSRGLLQTIGSTFSAYHIAGTSENIFNPLANVAAAINYAKHVYGPSLMSGGMGMGSGHGYAAGGVIPEKVMGVGVNTGMPYAFGSGEQVTPAGEANALASGANTGLLLPVLQEQNRMLAQLVRLGQQAPDRIQRGLNNAASGGANRAYYGG